MVRVPGAEHIVIVYDQNQEDEYINVSFPERCRLYSADYLKQWGEELKPHVPCEIPEIDLHAALPAESMKQEVCKALKMKI